MLAFRDRFPLARSHDILESRLIGWLDKAYAQNGLELDGISGEVKHSGEGLWTVETAQKLGVPVENIKQSLDFMDIGTSGGPGGARNGACLMIGGKPETFAELETLFKDISVENGNAHMGPVGAGHFVKMVHNGIEYGMMQAIGEGFEVLKSADKIFGQSLDLKKVTGIYNHGSVIESRLIGWLDKA